MEVDRRNFESLFPKITEQLRTCTFVAVDAEFSGLEPPPHQKSALRSLFDSAERRYQKARECACYFICQFGLAIFRRRDDSNSWDVDCYNFYLYPASFEEFDKEDQVIWQVSSIKFLKEFHFDFDLLLRHGIPYMKNRKVTELQDYLLANKDKAWADENVVKTQRGFARIIAAISAAGKPVVGHNMYTDLILSYHHFIDDLPDSYEDFKVGIREAFPLLYDTKVIAANMKHLLTVQQPDEDVSYLTNTSLYSLYKTTSDPPGRAKPHVAVSWSGHRYKEALIKGKREDLETVSSVNCHEAGFDACVTGSVFIQLAYVLWQHELASKNLPTNQPCCDIFDLFHVWANMINLPRARVPYINLTGKDPRSQRPPLILVNGHSNAANTTEISLKVLVRQLSQFGGCEGIYSTSGKNAALIACTNYKTFELAVKHLKRTGYIISDLRVQSDDNMEPVLPWGKLILLASTAWTAGLVALWKRLA